MLIFVQTVALLNYINKWERDHLPEVDVPGNTPNVLGFRVANLWTELTAHDVEAMVRNGTECKNH
jgi:hypothetical protein